MMYAYQNVVYLSVSKCIVAMCPSDAVCQYYIHRSVARNNSWCCIHIASFPGPLLKQLLRTTLDPRGLEFKGHASTLHARESLGTRLVYTCILCIYISLYNVHTTQWLPLCAVAKSICLYPVTLPLQLASSYHVYILHEKSLTISTRKKRKKETNILHTQATYTHKQQLHQLRNIVSQPQCLRK